MSHYTLPLSVGEASSNAKLAADLGKIYWQDGKGYRLCKAGAALASARRQTLVTAASSNVPTWVVNTSTTASDVAVVGVVPATQTDSAGASGLLSGDYFLIQCSGPCTVISAAAIAAGAAVGCSTTAGKVDDASITVGLGSIGHAVNSAGAGDANPVVILHGLL